MNEDLNSHGVCKDASFDITIIKLDIVWDFFGKFVGADEYFKIWFMFENKIKESEWLLPNKI